MARRLIFFQAHQEGHASGKLQAKIDHLEDQLAELKSKKISRTMASEKLEKIIKSVRKADDRPPPSPAPPQTQVQSIPRLKPKSFHRKGD
jgi:hypothetical protein